MAIRERVLAKLANIRKELYSAMEDDTVSLGVAMQDLKEVRGLCHRGLSQKFYAVYDEVFDGITAAGRHLANEVENTPVEEVLALCCDLLQEITVSVAKNQHFKREIVFLPYQASMWDSMESVWQAVVDDSEHAIAYVVPLPYFERNPDGSLGELRCETFGYPESVSVIDYRTVDLAAMHPDVIVIHNPYDGYNRVTMVPEEYFSIRLKSCTDRLVYIPYFVLREIDANSEKNLEDMAHFVLEAPAVVNADLVIIQSETMREAYIKLLTAYTNKNDRAFWESRILGLGSPKFDKVVAMSHKVVEIPENWRVVIEKKDGSRKKVIFYNVTVTSLQHKEKLLDKMEWVFRVFRERQEEVALLWRPHPLLEKTIHAMEPALAERYRAIVLRYQREGWGIYDDTDEFDRAITLSDACYGDLSSVTELFRLAGKPVMRQDVDVCTSFDVQVDFYYVAHEGHLLWYVPTKGKPVIYQADLHTGYAKVLAQLPYIKEGFLIASYATIAKVDDFLVLAPYHSDDGLTVFHLPTRKLHKVTIPDFHWDKDSRGAAFNAIIPQGKCVYCMGGMIDENVIVVIYDTSRDFCETHHISNPAPVRNKSLAGACLVGKTIYCAVYEDKYIVEIDIDRWEAKLLTMPCDYNIWCLSYTDGEIWLTPCKGNKVIYFSPLEDMFHSVVLPCNENVRAPLSGCVACQNKVCLFPNSLSVVYFYDKQTKDITVEAILSKAWRESVRGYSEEMYMRSAVYNEGDYSLAYTFPRGEVYVFSNASDSWKRHVIKYNEDWSLIVDNSAVVRDLGINVLLDLCRDAVKPFCCNGKMTSGERIYRVLRELT